MYATIRNYAGNLDLADGLSHSESSAVVSPAHAGF